MIIITLYVLRLILIAITTFINRQIHGGGLGFVELAQIVVLRELFGPNDRVWYDKTRPYKCFSWMLGDLTIIIEYYGHE